HVDKGGQSDRQILTCPGKYGAGSGIAIASKVGDFIGRREGRIAHLLTEDSQNAGGRGILLQASGASASTRCSGVRLDDDVACFATHSGSSMPDPPVQNQAAANSSAQSQHA